MIINLIGPIASGKSTFARWFINRHKEYQHYDISACRRLAANVFYIQDPKEIENKAWNLLYSYIVECPKCIVESTGTIYRLKDLWTPEIIMQGIYTVKLLASRKVCQERAKRRKSGVIKGYDLDECYGIFLDEEYQGKTPANLTLNVGSDNIEYLYEEVEKYIVQAADYFRNQYEVIGNNKGKEKK